MEGVGDAARGDQVRTLAAAKRVVVPLFAKLDAALSAGGVAALDAVLALLPPAPR